ncbi:molybdopterin molybdotransferase MoeA [Herbiconiux moechotypicola]|uniref:molybdopterin molybdotransferase MoeA n=1 Tax=Herbiconiux moechotypicola TaxID=637393 RepID=UPI00217F0347|nr:gephyrin-like molybdotransferase Glp [Herbiconiux moechotypicola]MCS5731887.1 molybdopterin molybdotransferase MoeA [Herbiconiux moechotypicola]
MRTIDDHLREVTALLAPLAARLEAETLPVSGAAIATDPARYAHRVLAADLVSPSALPAFDNSQMDGYAVVAAELTGATEAAPVRLAVAPRIAAGDPGATHRSGTATPVMTGAPVPQGADAVVQIERAIPSRFPADGETATVSFAAAVAPGTFVRPAGSDVAAGELLLAAGSELRGPQYGVIAGTGATEIEVRRRPRVLLVSTGHEIRDAGTALAPGQIYDANTVALTVALQAAGCAVTPLPCRSDDASDLLGLLAEHAADHDLLVTVGGVSAGVREVVRDALGPRGVAFMKVAMQPGGPQGFGMLRLDDEEGAPVALPAVCLPGNPVSALVSFEAFLRPALRSAQGLTAPLRELRSAPAAHPFDSPPTHHQLRRGVLNDQGALELVGGPSSHLLHSYATSTVLVHVPVGVTTVAAGDRLDYWRIDG